MRVPSGLLRVSWPSPRKEMMQFWLLVSQADPLFRYHKERTFRQRFPVVMKSSEYVKQLLVSFGWVSMYMSQCDMSEPECSRFSIKLWCQSFRKDFTFFFLLLSPSLPLPFQPPLVSILLIWPLYPSKSWFGLFTLWITISQISNYFIAKVITTSIILCRLLTCKAIFTGFCPCIFLFQKQNIFFIWYHSVRCWEP